MRSKNPGLVAKWQTLLKGVIGIEKPDNSSFVGERQKFNGIQQVNPT